MKKLKIVSGLLAIFIVMPIWYYILYQILTAINASELTWFLYWLYLPVTIFVAMVTRMLEE